MASAKCKICGAMIIASMGLTVAMESLPAICRNCDAKLQHPPEENTLVKIITVSTTGTTAFLAAASGFTLNSNQDIYSQWHQVIE